MWDIKAFEVLRQGGTFSDAIEQIRFFDRTTITLLKVADKVGNYKESILSAIDYLENKKSLWKSFSATLGWLSFDIFTSVSSVLLMKYKFFPWAKTINIADTSPEQTLKFERVLNQATFAVDVLLITTIIAAVLIVFTLGLMIFQRGKAYDIIDSLLVKIPVVKNIVYDGILASTFFSASKLLSAGISFSEVARMVSETTKLKKVKKLWADAYTRVLAGMSVYKAMDNPLLNSIEKAQLSSHQNKKQLSMIFDLFSSERNYSYSKGIKRLIIITVIAVIFYIAIIALIAIYVVWIQNEIFVSSLKNIGNF